MNINIQYPLQNVLIKTRLFVVPAQYHAAITLHKHNELQTTPRKALRLHQVCVGANQFIATSHK
jgi:hypothetical protein